jgi:hypothetical protein
VSAPSKTLKDERSSVGKVIMSSSIEKAIRKADLEIARKALANDPLVVAIRLLKSNGWG